MRYDLRCPACNIIEERSVSMSAADQQICKCGAFPMTIEIAPLMMARTNTRFEGGAILANGQKIPGNFGREARKHKGRWL